MEREKSMYLCEGNIMAYGMGMHNELNGSSEQCLFNPNWDNSMDQNDPFESALNSMVSSPVTSNAAAAAQGNDSENIVLRELIGKLGSICNSGNRSTNTSCYTTPLNSPPKLNLSMMRGNHLPAHPSLATLSADPGFVYRAARFSCFANNTLVALDGNLGMNHSEEGGKLSRVSSNQSFRVCGSQMNGGQGGNAVAADHKLSSRLSRSQDTEFGDSPENSSVSEQIPVGEISSRKRKSISKGKGKDADAAAENNESSAKKSKSDENDTNENDPKPNAGQNKKQGKDNLKSAEPPKDYIHVRARRGQATDAHSLAERVRREKISQRMKLLQDLVPGCDKVTGKAVMLDEIINYVQSLQRQVEFLSMKLSTINPRMDVDIQALLSKNILQSHGFDTSTSAFPFQSQQVQTLHNDIPNGTDMPLPMNHLNAAVSRNASMQLTSEAASRQPSMFWEYDLQSVVFGQNVDGVISSAEMKVEL